MKCLTEQQFVPCTVTNLWFDPFRRFSRTREGHPREGEGPNPVTQGVDLSEGVGNRVFIRHEVSSSGSLPEPGVVEPPTNSGVQEFSLVSRINSLS